MSMHKQPVSPQTSRLSVVAVATVLTLNAGLSVWSGHVWAQPMTSTTALFNALSKAQPNVQPGQSATQLADGRWLIMGGAKGMASSQAQLIDASGKASMLPAAMSIARSEHTATLMPDGSVWILGGQDASGKVLSTAERFDPGSGSFTSLGEIGLLARARHTSTVLADGRLLVAGGVDKRGAVLPLAEIYDPQTQQVMSLPNPVQTPRAQQSASLLPNHDVLLWGGVDARGNPVNTAEAYDPAAQRFMSVSAQELKSLAQTLTAGLPAVQDSIPAANAKDVAVNQALVVRLSKRMAVASFNSTTVTLVGPAGAVAINPVALEGGLLLFVNPSQQLRPAASYTLFVRGATDEFGQALPPQAIGFKTAALDKGGTQGNAAAQAANAILATPGQMRPPIGNLGQPDDDEDGDEVWIPGDGNFHGNWISGRRHLSRRSMPNHEEVRRTLHGDDTFARLTPADVARRKLPTVRHMAPNGVTAVAGQVLKLNGRPLANATLSIGKQSVKTDRNGEFLLSGIASGPQTLVIDAETADRGRQHYGRYEYIMDIKAGETNALPFVIWMTRLDTAGAVNIDSPTKSETVITNQHIPGLELRIPAGTVIRDINGKVVTELTMTAIPVDQPPFPLPNIPVPVYFTVQPGGAHLEGINAKSAKGARLIYPNYTGSAPGARFSFWNYDSTKRGWFVYGEGTVSADGKQIIPDEGVVIYEFTGAMVGSPGNAPPGAPGASGKGGGGSGTPACGQGGDPVDLHSGLFLNYANDLTISDVIPISIERAYRPADDKSRAFGIGTNLSYDSYLVGSLSPWTYQDLILPDGGRVHFDRISTGTSYTDAVYRSNTSDGDYYGSVIKWDTSYPGSSWSLTRKDGMVFYFAEAMGSTSARAGAIIGVRDRFGNITQLTRDSYANLTQITSPSGRKVTLTYDTSNRITQITDDIGRQIKYAYDASGRLVKVTDPAGKTQQFTYASMTVSAAQSIGGVTSTTNLLTVTDKLNQQALKNDYDANGRVIKQTLADGRTFTFAYTLSPYTNPVTGVTSQVATQTDMTDERGTVTRYVFNAFNGKPSSITVGLGKPEQQLTTFNWNATTKLLDSVVDPINRITAYKYDDLGNVIEVTKLSGTPQRVVEKKTFDSTYSLATSVVNAFGNAFNFSYNSQGGLIRASSPTGESFKFGSDARGRYSEIEDPLGQIWQLTYSGGDLSGIKDPLARKFTFFSDAVGRLRSMVDPLGNYSYVQYDELDRVTSRKNARGYLTQETYDAAGNILTQVDERSNATAFGYDARGRRSSMKDGLLKTDQYGYEPGGNINQIIDRKGQLTALTYDALGRVTQIGYGATVAAPTVFQSTVVFTWDAANRLTKVVDSVAGTITRSYDDFDRLINESTPQGTVSYTYDAIGRRTSMTVQGQPVISYTWDVANRLTAIQQAASASSLARTVSFVYDSAGRRQKTIFANGITGDYAYDGMNRIKSITYKKDNGNLIGDLTYAYDEVGNIIGKGGSLWGQSQGTVATGVAFNANNQQTAWNGKTLTYDANGNLTNDGSSTYVWDERNRLKSISGAVTASFQYDAFDRRIAKVVGGLTTGYVYDGLNFVQEKAGTAPASAVVANIVTGIDLDDVYFRQDSSGTVTTVLTDIQGSAVLVTDASQATVAAYIYDPYGNTAQAGVSANTQQYTGRENDVTGLYYYRARYYNPTLGRFISEDPIGWSSGQTNSYAYVGGNPASMIDPLGLLSLSNQGPISFPRPPGPGSSSACATAECAAGLPPAPIDPRTASQINFGQCKLVCTIVATPPVAACNLLAGGGLPGALLGTAGKSSVCSWVCSK